MAAAVVGGGVGDDTLPNVHVLHILMAGRCGQPSVVQVVGGRRVARGLALAHACGPSCVIPSRWPHTMPALGQRQQMSARTMVGANGPAAALLACSGMGVHSQSGAPLCPTQCAQGRGMGAAIAKLGHAEVDRGWPVW